MRSLIAFFVKYAIWADMLALVILLFGLINFNGLNVNFFPEAEQRIITIEVIHPGASPLEMEEGVVLKVEESLKGIEGIEEVTSVSRENVGTIIVNGLKGFDQERLLSDVKNAVDRINSFPVDAEKPVVYRNKQIERVNTLLLTGTNDLLTLKKHAELIEDDLLAKGVVTQIELSGFPDLEISVEISEEDLRRHQLTFEEISNAIRKNNIDLSSGSIKTSEEELLIRSRSKSTDAFDIGNIILRSSDEGAILRIKDVAEVKSQFADAPNKTLYNGKRAVTIQASKTKSEDMIFIADYLKKYVDKYNQNSHLLELIISNDSSTIVRQRIELLTKNGIVGLFLVIVVLGFFLNIRLAFWVSFAIPLSFLGMFIVAGLVGITINVISLFGMILVVGILVDDGIVIAENIYTHYENGEPPVKAAINGTMEVFPSVFASVSTTIVMFIPFFFLDGRMGEFFADLGVVVIACLAMSLLEGAFILPAHLAHSKGLSKQEKSGFRKSIDKGIDFLRYKLYGKVLLKINNYPYIVISFSLAFVLIVSGMMSGGFIKTTFFPFVDSDNVTVELSLKPGKRETLTEEILKDIEAKIWEVNKELSAERKDSNQVILSTRLEVGTGGTSEKGLIEVELLDGETRDLESFKIAAAIRNKIGIISEAEKFSVGARQIFGKPIAISLMGKDLETLEKAKKFLKDELSSFPTLKDINDNDELGKREINIKLKPEAYFMGMTTQDISRQLRQGFFGDEVQRLQKGNDELKVWVRYKESDRISLGNIDNSMIKFNGKEYPFSALVDYEIKRDVVAIGHFDGAREIKVDADLADQNEPVPPILASIKEDVIPQVQSMFPGVRVAFEGQDKENVKFRTSASKAFTVAFAILMIILTLTFRSWSQMVLVLTMIPLGVFGAFFGHFIEAKPLSIFSFYGIIALAGVVINDSVVFLDKYNRNLKKGLNIKEAVYDAGVARFRAILLTTLTTVAGLYPLILEKSRQAQFLIPMAISVAWGIVFVTIFVLFVFPSIIIIFNDIRYYLAYFWEGKKPLNKEMFEPAVIEQKNKSNE